MEQKDHQLKEELCCEQTSEHSVDPNVLPENNLVRISSFEQYQLYLKGLESSVEQFKQMYPEKYEKAQSIGDDMMNKKYELRLGEDVKGDLLKCKNILDSIYQYELEKSDLYENELELLQKILTCGMNIVHDINDIFENVESIEKIINVLIDKLTELEHEY